MAWTVYQLFLAGLMLITGSINTLSTKWADKCYASGNPEYGKAYAEERKFDHPFLQSVGMFIGELSCLLVFKFIFFASKRQVNAGKELSAGTKRLIDGNQGFHPIVFWPAALCDMCGTTLMYIGLNMTDASSFQMLRGAVIVFTALLSVTFLGRSISKQMWLGILFVILGLVVVGLADFFQPKDPNDVTDTNLVITGDLLIVIAQIITASQMVYEEKYVSRHSVAPLQAVGWEGFFGFITLSVLLVPMYFIQVGPGGSFITSDPEYRLENALDAFYQMGSNPLIIVAQLGNVISIAFFNFAGISVTRELSATTRMVLDSLRTVVIWVVSVIIWDPFVPLQIPGFLLLGLGTAVYNGLLNKPYRMLRNRLCRRETELDDEEPIIN
ncbi:solute carrier family 35 member F6-like isoform X1 [Watersipora subatra]|uniref:solute carrier family 35 member F6-like isoform X1 n=1 Tax=Watersipora subatra TaxID=2589382 RepID=UPI00355C76B9